MLPDKPNPDKIYNFGSPESYKFISTARDLKQEKYFIFKNTKDQFLLITKDEWYGSEENWS